MHPENVFISTWNIHTYIHTYISARAAQEKGQAALGHAVATNCN